MKKGNIWFLGLFLVLVLGMIGCNNSGGSSSGGSSSTTTPTTTPTTTTTNPLVGTWKEATGVLPSLTFNANGTGYFSDGVHTITSWTLSSSNVLTMTIPQTETFQLTWKNDAKTSMSLHNLSPSDETTNYTKS